MTTSNAPTLAEIEIWNKLNCIKQLRLEPKVLSHQILSIRGSCTWMSELISGSNFRKEHPVCLLTWLTTDEVADIFKSASQEQSASFKSLHNLVYI